MEQRRRFLNYFTQKIAERPYLFDSDIFQTFLRGDPDFERVQSISFRLLDTSQLTSMPL